MFLIVNPHIGLQNLKFMFMDCDGLICVAKNLRIFGGFTGAFNLSIMSYFIYLKILHVVSSGSFMSTSSSSLRRITCHIFSFLWKEMIPWFCCWVLVVCFTNLSSYVAVYTGLEDIIAITLVFLVGESWFATSQTTFCDYFIAVPT